MNISRKTLLKRIDAATRAVEAAYQELRRAPRCSVTLDKYRQACEAETMLKTALFDHDMGR